MTTGRRGGRLGGAADLLIVGGLVFATSLLAIQSAWLSGGTLVLWPADGLIVGLMLTSPRKRPWLIMAAGLVGSLLAFLIVGRQMVLGVSRVGLMSVGISTTYLLVRRITAGRAIAEAPVLLPFLFACLLIGIPTAFVRSVILNAFWGFPIAKLTLTTTAATFAGYAVITPMVLLLTQPRQGDAASVRAKIAMWGLAGLYTLAMTAAFLEPRYPAAYLVPLALILVAHAMDFTGIVVVILATAIVSVGLTFSGYGPIGHFPGDMKEKVLLMQSFLAIIICTSLPFSALMNDRGRLRTSLIAALEEARSASQAKSTFLATMSHEIRTPLNGVLGMAQAIEMDELTPAQRERVAVVRRSGESLLSLLNDILDLSKVEAGQLTLEAIAFDPTEVIAAVVEQSEALAAGKGLILQADTDGLHGVYEGDPHRIRQIIQNLVSNAIKFTDSGSVTIIGRGAENSLTVQVRDTGMGVPAEKLGELFQKFRQMDESTTRRFGGTGLGLSICRELGQAMGGDVTVESVEGLGSTFTLHTPLRRVEGGAIPEAAPRRAAPAPEPTLRVLAAEDNATNQLVLSTLLGAAGIAPTIVGNGAEAVAAWRSEDWDVILMDVQMPVMDGLAAVKAIRAEEAFTRRSRTMIVALTANAMPEQVRQYLEVGMDDYLAKPISVEQLFGLLAKIQPSRRPAATPSRTHRVAA